MKKILPKLVLALSACAAVGASAQTVYSGQADQERRDRNREEALSNYRAGTSSSTATTTSGNRSTVREETHKAAEATRRGTHRVAESTRRVTHKSANAVRRAGHKTAEKAREVTARADAKFGKSPNPVKTNPEGINPVATRTPPPTAPSNGVTK